MKAIINSFHIKIDREMGNRRAFGQLKAHQSIAHQG